MAQAQVDEEKEDRRRDYHEEDHGGRDHRFLARRPGDPAHLLADLPQKLYRTADCHDVPVGNRLYSAQARRTPARLAGKRRGGANRGLCRERRVIAPKGGRCQQITGFAVGDGRSGGARTPNPRFWRPVLYQLSYTPILALPSSTPLCMICTTRRMRGSSQIKSAYDEGVRPRHFKILATTPAPTVRPPSRMAKRRPSSMAMGAISSTSICTLSPGITISVPSLSFTVPVTSVVRK